MWQWVSFFYRIIKQSYTTFKNNIVVSPGHLFLQCSLHHLRVIWPCKAEFLCTKNILFSVIFLFENDLIKILAGRFITGLSNEVTQKLKRAPNIFGIVNFFCSTYTTNVIHNVVPFECDLGHHFSTIVSRPNFGSWITLNGSPNNKNVSTIISF